MTAPDPFSMKQLDHELEQLWLTIKEEQYRTDQFSARIKTASTLNSVAIILLCVSVLIMFYVIQHEGVLPHLKGAKDHG